MSIGAVNWDSWVPATAADHTVGFFDLPAFDVAAPIWRGASEIVRQYNYSASKNFAFRARPSKPAGVNYGLCVRFRQGNIVTRYKLWDDANFILPGVPMYGGQGLKKNFCLEVWSLQDQANLSQTAAIRLTGTIRRTVTDFSAIPADYSDADGATVTREQLLNVNVPAAAPPATNLAAWYKPDTGITDSGTGFCTQWDDQSGNGRHLVQGNGALRPQIIPQVAAGFPTGLLRFDGIDDILAYAGAGFGLQHVFVILRQQAWALGLNVLRHHAGGGYGLRLYQGASASELSCEFTGAIASNVPFISGTAIMAELRHYVGENGRLRYLDKAANFVASANAAGAGAPSAKTNLELGSAQVDIAEVIGYAAGVGAADMPVLWNYLGNKYGSIVSILPISFDSSSPWLDNSP